MMTFFSTHALYFVVAGVALAVAALFIWAGLRVIAQDESGLVIKKFGPELAPGRLIGLDGEAGYQARMLPPGWHFGLWRWRYKVVKLLRVRADAEATALRMRAEAEATATRLHGEGEGEAVRSVGAARAEAYRLGRESLGSEAYTATVLATVLAENGMKLVPDIAVGGAQGGIAEALLARMLAAGAPNGRAALPEKQ